MPCFCPIDVWPAAPPATGLVFSATRSYAGAKASQIPCGKCMGCRISRKEEWKNRLLLEGSMHECSSFVTLTYAPEFLPTNYSLSRRHLQTWLKRLRFVLDPLRIRFFAVGEYGDTNFRPHYHAIIFGYDFPDRYLWRMGKHNMPLYRSELLERTWNLGHAEIGTFGAMAAGYVSGYTIKKMGGEYGAEHYRRMNPDTGEIHQVEPEFSLMSRRPGIGRAWFDANARDAFPSDYLIVDGKKRQVPRYFKRLLDAQNEKMSSEVNAKRKAAGRKPSRDRTEEGLRRREEHARYLQTQRAKKELD